MARILIYEVAIQKIVDLIITRRLQPGERLPAERELAKELQISRACIREALQALSSTRVVKIRRGSGIYVNVLNEAVLARHLRKEPSKEEILDGVRNIVEMRKLLETHGFQQAAKTVTHEQLHLLHSHEAHEYSRLLSGDYYRSGANMDFENLILTFQPNSLLTNTHGNLNETWKMYMQQLNAIAMPLDIRHRDHLAVILAIESGSAKQIAKAVSVHLDGTFEAVKRLTQ